MRKRGLEAEGSTEANEDEMVDVEPVKDERAETGDKEPKTGSPLRKKQCSDQGWIKEGTHTPEVGPEGTKLWDLGGNGDCGYRALAAGLAKRNGKTKEAIEGKMAALVKSLRAQVVQQMTVKDVTWKQGWAMDSEATETMENGKVPTTVEEFVEAIQRPKRWMCSRVIQAAARVMKVDVVIFEWKNGTWRKVAKIDCKGAQDPADIIPLLLVGDHFITVERPAGGWPKHWSGKTTGQWKGRASGKNADSNSSVGSWLRPARSEKRCPSEGGAKASTQVRKSSDACSGVTSYLKPASTVAQTRGKVATTGFRTSAWSGASGSKANVSKQKGIRAKVTEVERWECPICAMTVTAETKRRRTAGMRKTRKWKTGRRPISGRISSHLMRHKEEVTKIREDNWKRLGIKITGLGLIEQREPVEFSADIPEEQRARTCPYCKKGLGHIGARRWLNASFKHHLKTCRPGASQREAYEESIRQGRYMLGNLAGNVERRKQKMEKSLQKMNKVLGKNGHRIEARDVKWPMVRSGKTRLGAFKSCIKCRGLGKSMLQNHAKRPKEKCKEVKFQATWMHGAAKPSMQWWKTYVEASSENKEALESLWRMTDSEKQWREQELAKMGGS